MVKLKHSRGLPDFRYLQLDGSNANTNIDIGNYNLTANAFYGDGTTLTGIAVIPLDHGADLINVTADQHHPQLHSIVSHNDTTATGPELDTLTDNSIADTLHRHSELVASDGAPDPAVSVDADGIVSMPYQSGCKVRLTSDQTITTSTLTKLQFGTEDWDIQGEFDNAVNYRFTAKRAGYYQVNIIGRINAINDAKQFYLYIYKNGSSVAVSSIQSALTTTTLIYNISDIVYLDGIDDYIEGWVYHNHGSDRIMPDGVDINQMSIIKIV